VLATGGGESAIPGDPAVLRRAADDLEASAKLAETVLEEIGAARFLALSGWSAPSAEGFDAFTRQADSRARELIGAGRSAAPPLLEYAEALERAQRAYAAAEAEARAAEGHADRAEDGSRAQRRAREQAEDAAYAMGSAREAALAANERAAAEIGALGGTEAAASERPGPASARADQGFLDYLANDLGGDLKGAFGGDLGIGDPGSETYQAGEGFWSKPVPRLAMNVLGPAKFKLGGQAVVGGVRTIPRVADDVAKAAVGAAAATAAVLGGIVYAQRGKGNKSESGLKGLSEKELRDRVKDKSLPAEERQKAVREEKARSLRNKQKRGN